MPDNRVVQRTSVDLRRRGARGEIASRVLRSCSESPSTRAPRRWRREQALANQVDPLRTGGEELERDALTAPPGVSYDSPFEGVETKGLWRGRGSPYCVARRARHGGQRSTERGRVSVLQPSTADD